MGAEADLSPLQLKALLAAGLPARCDLETGFSGDADAGLDLVYRAPNSYRGLIALAAYKLAVPNPGYREIVRAVWDHDHDQLLAETNRNYIVIRGMFRHGEFDCSALPDPVTIYRGTNGLPLKLAARGLAWTTSRDNACAFAWGVGDRSRSISPADDDWWPLVLTANVRRSDVIFYSNERGEEEIITSRTPINVTVDPGDDADWEAGYRRNQAETAAYNGAPLGR